MEHRRHRVTLDLPSAPCQLCRGATAVTRSTAVRQGLARLNPTWDPDVRVYELCQVCGAKRPLAEHRRA